MIESTLDSHLMVKEFFLVEIKNEQFMNKS